MVDRYDEDSINAFLQVFKRAQQDSIRANLKADALILAGITGWNAYKPHQAAVKQQKKPGRGR